MWDFFFNGYEFWQIAVLCVGAVLIGVNKTGIPGLGILPVVLLMLVFDYKLSTGLQLIMLCAADLMAVAYYRRHADWKIIGRIIPFCFLGLAIGALTLRLIDNPEILRPAIGILVLILMTMNFFKGKIAAKLAGKGVAVAAFFGILVGFTTQIANAAGPISAIYLLLTVPEKHKYMGVASWLFLIINWTKLPIFIWEGRVTLESLRMDSAMIPFVLLGGVLGVIFVKKIPQKGFESVVQILVIVSALFLCLKPLLKQKEIVESPELSIPAESRE